MSSINHTALAGVDTSALLSPEMRGLYFDYGAIKVVDDSELDEEMAVRQEREQEAIDRIWQRTKSGGCCCRPKIPKAEALVLTHAKPNKFTAHPAYIDVKLTGLHSAETYKLHQLHVSDVYQEAKKSLERGDHPIIVNYKFQRVFTVMTDSTSDHIVLFLCFILVSCAFIFGIREVTDDRTSSSVTAINDASGAVGDEEEERADVLYWETWQRPDFLSVDEE